MDYIELRSQVIKAGLLDRQYWFYFYKSMFNVLLLSISVFVLLTVDNFALQLLNAVFLAFIVVQFGLVMHDADHQQVFKSQRNNEFLGMITGSLILNVSSSAWTEVHNRHHSSPNHVDADPDIEVPGLSYTEEQALGKKGILKFVAKYQAYFWLLIMSFAAFSIRLNHHRKVFLAFFVKAERDRLKHHLSEAILLGMGTSLYFWLVFSSLGAGKGVVFTIVNYLLTGLYMGTIFATNHKGMPIINKGGKSDFFHDQVLTARNVKGSILTDFWTGGLNYQIEHHLFPTMPRNNLSKAKKIVEPFCRKVGIEYYETGFFRSYKEILQNFHKVSAVLRKSRVGAALASFASKA